jgi:hypothetical protein
MGVGFLGTLSIDEFNAYFLFTCEEFPLMINGVFEQHFMPLTYCVVTSFIISHESFDSKIFYCSSLGQFS